MNEVLNRLEILHASYEKERENEDSVVDISVACSLADSIPYLIKQVRHLEHEKNLLYGRLNNIRSLLDKEVI